MRVSTDEQAEHGHGLDLQKEKILAYVKLHNHVLDKDRHFFVDEGYSGTLPANKRPAMQRMFEAAERKEFDMVLVYRLDRFGRKILVVLDGVQYLDDCGVAFSSVTEPFDTSNAFGRYLLSSLGALAELERDTIKERTQGGRRIAAAGNRWIWGTPPYGYKIDHETKKLSVVEEEAKVVRKFMEWIADEGLTLTEVQRRANREKIPCYNKRKRKKAEMEGYWHKKTIHKMVCNQIYTGSTYFFRYKGDFKGLSSVVDESLQNDREQWIKFKTEAIVTDDLHKRCRRQLEINRNKAARNLKNDYLFNKLVHCGRCDRKMYAGMKKGYKYYHTAYNEKWRRAIVDDKRCHSCGQISERVLMPVWEELEALLRDPNYVIPKLHTCVTKPKFSHSLDKKLAESSKELTRLVAQSKKIDSVYLNGDSIPSHEEYLRLKGKAKKEIQGLKNDIKAMEGKKDALQGMSEKDTNNMVELFNKLSYCLDDASYAQKSLVIHLLVRKIEVDRVERKAIVYLNTLKKDAALSVPSPLNQEFVSRLLHDQRSHDGYSVSDRAENNSLSHQRLY